MSLPVHCLQIPDAEFVVCDVETTGLSHEHHRITEIALVKVVDGEIVDRYQSLVNPKQFIPREITALTGITNEMVYDAPTAEEVLPAVKRFVGEAVFVGHNARFDRSFVDATLRRIGDEPLMVPSLCTARLARRLTPTLARKSLGSIAAHLGIRNPRAHRAGGDAETTARVFLQFVQTLAEEFDVLDVAELISFQNKPVYRVTSPPKNFPALKPALDALPHDPGVYFFRDKRKHIVYIGKARDLHDRVHSYFRHNIGHTEKIQRLSKAVASIEWESTETELSALLAEARAIRRHQPRFNTMLKTMRSYPFIRIDRDDPYPTIRWTYDIEDDRAEYFGPFSSRFAVERTLEIIERLFLVRECDGRLKPSASAAPCLYYEIKRCGAPCALLQSHAEYLDEIRRVGQFLHGRHDDVLDGLRAAMEAKAEAMDFEGAAVVRDRLQTLERVVRQQRVMTRSIREQNLVIVTLAKRTNVELHCIKGGMLAKQQLVDQKSIPRVALRALLTEVFGGQQPELFQSSTEDINEMRIIASWCLTRRDESSVVEVDQHAGIPSLLDAVVAAVRDAGRAAPVQETAAS
ncbi:MAG: DEDD exonuclease domain-containing protein [Ignavibacteria bacterium]|nr:DEDD exonuclease domain-containing protein [Ignavibacteria bacterium]